ncbi:MAG TPA: DUF3152 domain-containing protein [Acidimicrobiia bacterium]
MTGRAAPLLAALVAAILSACLSPASSPTTTVDTTPPTTSPSTTAAPTTTIVPTTPPTTSSPPSTTVAAADDCLPAALGQADGTLVVVPGSTPAVGGDDPKTFAVEVEEGLGVDGECFAGYVNQVLQDARGWIRAGFSFARTDASGADLVVALASPPTVDSRCAPLKTNGWLSCWDGSRAMLNVVRWAEGIPAYDDLWAYRTYLINHEVGHGLGYGHQDCPGPGEVAPLMMQQTIGLEGCTPNPWPTQDEM